MIRGFILALLLCSGALAQVPTPQIPLTGTLGAAGPFPLLNSGSFAIPSDANYTVAYPNYTCISCTITSAVTLTATRNVVMPAGWFIINACNYTSGGQSIQIIGPTGTGATIANGVCAWVRWDGTNWVLSGAGGTVTCVGIGAGWPSWLSPAVANACTTPSISAAVSAIPNAALANSSIPINGTTCVLGTPCTISGTGYSLGGTLTSGNVSNLPAGASVGSISGLDGSHAIDIHFTSAPASGMARVYTLTFTTSRGHSAFCVYSPGNATTAQTMSQLGQIVVNNIGATSYEIWWNNATGITGLLDLMFNVSCP